MKTHHRWIIVSLFVAGILAGSLLGVFAPTNRYGADKVLHFLGYSGLMVLLCFAFSANAWRKQLMAASIAFLLGLAVEGVQHFLPQRKASLDDIAFNLLGVLAGWVLIRLWVTIQKRRG